MSPFPASKRNALAGNEMTQNTLRGAVFQRLANSLLADAEFLNDGFVAFGIGLSEIVEQATSLAHHHKQAAPGGVILLMRLEMLRQFTNTLAQDRDLDLRGTSVGIVSAILVNQG